MPRYRRNYTAQILGVVILAALLFARWQGWLSDIESGRTAPWGQGGLRPGMYEVERVVDGDTLLLRRDGRLRLQGINCPEIPHEGHPGHPLGPAAVTFTQEFIRDAHHRVRIEVDGEPKDHYDRWLAFVWDGDRLLNEELVRAGLARAMLRYDYGQAKKNRLAAAQREAQRAGVGIWAESAR
jgi:endonuclease YncB( thermonuclease family)